MSRIYLYGLAGARESYRVVRYSYIEEDLISINEVKRCASWLRMNNPTVEQVFAIDDRKGLCSSYRKAIRKNSIEGFIIFRDLLQRYGIEVE